MGTVRGTGPTGRRLERLLHCERATCCLPGADLGPEQGLELPIRLGFPSLRAWV
jgi:hypothetical protein